MAWRSSEDRPEPLAARPHVSGDAGRPRDPSRPAGTVDRAAPGGSPGRREDDPREPLGALGTLDTLGSLACLDRLLAGDPDEDAFGDRLLEVLGEVLPAEQTVLFVEDAGPEPFAVFAVRGPGLPEAQAWSLYRAASIHHHTPVEQPGPVVVDVGGGARFTLLPLMDATERIGILALAPAGVAEATPAPEADAWTRLARDLTGLLRHGRRHVASRVRRGRVPGAPSASAPAPAPPPALQLVLQDRIRGWTERQDRLRAGLRALDRALAEASREAACAQDGDPRASVLPLSIDPRSMGRLVGDCVRHVETTRGMAAALAELVDGAACDVARLDVRALAEEALRIAGRERKGGLQVALRIDTLPPVRGDRLALLCALVDVWRALLPDATAETGITLEARRLGERIVVECVVESTDPADYDGADAHDGCHRDSACAADTDGDAASVLREALAGAEARVAEHGGRLQASVMPGQRSVRIVLPVA